MDGMDQPDEVRQQSSGCIWPSPSPVKQSTDRTQYSRPCEPPLHHQPRHVSHTPSQLSPRVKGGRTDMQTDTHKKSLHLIWSLHADKASGSRDDFNPRSSEIRFMIYFRSGPGRLRPGKDQPIKDFPGNPITGFNIGSHQSIYLRLLSID